MRSIQYNNLDISLFATRHGSKKLESFMHLAHKRRSIISELLLRSFKRGDIISNDFTDYGDDESDHLQLHYGICTLHKTHPEYALPFTTFVPNFIGLIDKVFHDTNTEDPELDPVPYVMRCVGSWKHDMMRGSPPIRNRWLRVREALRIPDVRVPTYKESAKKVVYFLSNAGLTSYWFGWTRDGIQHWLRHEKRLIKRAINEAPVHMILYIKPHPLIHDDTLQCILSELEFPKEQVYTKNCSLNIVLSNCAYGVVNTGTSFYHFLTRGVPIVCMDDTYSSFPVHRFALNHPRHLPYISSILSIDKLHIEMDRLASNIVLQDEFSVFISEIRKRKTD